MVFNKNNNTVEMYRYLKHYKNKMLEKRIKTLYLIIQLIQKNYTIKINEILLL